MPTLHCACGQVIKVPSTLTHRAARCNRCGAVVRLDGAAGVEASDLEALPPVIESRGEGEPKNCGDCGKRFRFDQLRRLGDSLVCSRCRSKREDARRRRNGRIVKAIALVMLVAGGAFAYREWIGPAIPKYRDEQAGANPNSVLADAVKQNAARSSATTKDGPKAAAKDAATSKTDPASPLSPAAGELATFTGAQLMAIAPAAKTVVLFKQDHGRPPLHLLRTFDMKDGRALRSLATNYHVDDMAVSDDGGRLMTIGRVGANAELRLWNLADMQVIASAPVLESFGRVGITPDGSQGWCLCPQEGIRIVDGKTWMVELFKETHVGSAYAQFDGSRRLAAVKCNFGAGGGVQQWIDLFDLEKRRLLHKIDPGERFGCFAMSPDGSMIALGFADRIDIYDFEVLRGWQRASHVKRTGMKNAPERLMITPDNAVVIELPFGADGRSPVARGVAGGEERKIDAGACIDWALSDDGGLYVLSEGEAVKRFDLTTGKAE